MEHTNIENEAIEQVVISAGENEILTLNDLQLTVVGGGIGDIVAA